MDSASRGSVENLPLGYLKDVPFQLFYGPFYFSIGLGMIKTKMFLCKE